MGKECPLSDSPLLMVGGFRVLAHLETDLGAVVHELDLLAQRYAAGSADGEEFVTAVVAQVAGTTLTLANSGHPPPLLIADRVRALEPRTPAVPLGIGSKPAIEQHHLHVGDRVLFYTDGTIEARDRSGTFFDLDSTATTLDNGSLDEGLVTIIERLAAHIDGRIDDDVALMAIEI